MGDVFPVKFSGVYGVEEDTKLKIIRSIDSRTLVRITFQIARVWLFDTQWSLTFLAACCKDFMVQYESASYFVRIMLKGFPKNFDVLSWWNKSSKHWLGALHPKKLTWQWKSHPFPIGNASSIGPVFHCYISIRRWIPLLEVFMHPKVAQNFSHRA